ncbi:MAG: hypothetical protein ACW99F_15135 [Candidatus Hodarchaeales archaeon]
MSEQKQKSGGKYAVEKLKLIRKHWFGGRCMHMNEDGTQCSKTYDLELAHAIETTLSKNQPSSRASWDRLNDAIENPECLLLFCSIHHREFDGRTSDAWQADYYVYRGSKN